MRRPRTCKRSTAWPSTPRSMLLAWLLLFTPAMAAWAQATRDYAVLVEGTGTYTRPISTDSEAAQRFFDQGLRLTWGYYFPEALASFREAERYAPAEPMIYWGMALAIAPNPNSRRAGRADDPAGDGLEAIRRALALIDPTASPIEHALIDTLYVRYDTESYPQREERDRAYYERSQQLLERYPEDPDVAALFADAFMTMRPWEYWDEQGFPFPGTDEVSRTLERSMRQEPSHPGTHHLYLHLHEASARPEQALAVADRLEALMPGAGHIVHMPSHIYIRVGQYAKAVAQNQRAVEADERFMAAWGDREVPFVTSLPMSHVFHAWHAYDFMLYAAIQSGNYARSLEAAQAALRTAQSFSGSGPCAADRNILSLWFVERTFGKWEALLGRLQEEPDDQCVLIRGMWSYMRGSALNGLGRSLQAKREFVALLTYIETHAPDDDLLAIASASLEGEIKQSDGDLEGAISAFRTATTLEAALPYAEPPVWPLPMRRFLGAALLALGLAAEAEEAYSRDLAWNQNNGWSLYGLWQSLQMQNRTREAEAARSRFEEAWQQADVTLSDSRF